MAVNEELLQLADRLLDLEEELSLYRVNGLRDAFSGSGNQTFGGGIMRLDKNGMQIKGVNTATDTLWWVHRLTADPLSLNPKATVGGKATTTTASWRATLYDSTGLIVGGLTFNTSDVATTNLVQWYNSHAGAVLKATTGGATPRGIFSLSDYNTILQLASLTADPTNTLADAMLWYRSDLFRPRIRSNGITGNLGIEIESATALAVATGGTITSAGVSAARVAPAAAVTGVILAVGTTGGQMCTVVNESVAASTVTFAAAATSNVADGVLSVIAGLNARTFCWDSVTALWYPVK